MALLSKICLSILYEIVGFSYKDMHIVNLNTAKHVILITNINELTYVLDPWLNIYDSVSQINSHNPYYSSMTEDNTYYPL